MQDIIREEQDDEQADDKEWTEGNRFFIFFEDAGDAGEGGEKIGDEKFDDGEFPTPEEDCDGEAEEPVATADQFFFAEELEEVVDSGEEAGTEEDS